MDSDKLEKIARLDRARVKEFSNLSNEEIGMRLTKMKLVNASENFRFRPLTIEQAQRSATALKQLRENEEKLKERYDERKEKLLELRERLQACKNDSDDCRQMSQEAMETSKSAALNAAERILAHLEKVKERISSSQDLTDETLDEETARVDAIIAKVQGINASIEAATTKEELNTAIRQLKAIISKIKIHTEEAARRLVRARVNGLLRSNEVIEKKIDCAVSGLNGTGTSSVDAKLDEYATLMEQARNLITESGKINASDRGALQEAKSNIDEANEQIRQAKNILKSIREEVKPTGSCEQEQEIVIAEDPEDDYESEDGEEGQDSEEDEAGDEKE